MRPRFPSAAQLAGQVLEIGTNQGGAGGYPPNPPCLFPKFGTDPDKPRPLLEDDCHFLKKAYTLRLVALGQRETPDEPQLTGLDRRSKTGFTWMEK